MVTCFASAHLGFSECEQLESYYGPLAQKMDIIKNLLRYKNENSVHTLENSPHLPGEYFFNMYHELAEHRLQTPNGVIKTRYSKFQPHHGGYRADMYQDNSHLRNRNDDRGVQLNPYNCV